MEHGGLWFNVHVHNIIVRVVEVESQCGQLPLQALVRGAGHAHSKAGYRVVAPRLAQAGM